MYVCKIVWWVPRVGTPGGYPCVLNAAIESDREYNFCMHSFLIVHVLAHIKKLFIF